MENAIARPRYTRRPVQNKRRRRSGREAGGLGPVILRQFVICVLLLIIVCIVKGVPFSAADYVTDKVKYVISYNVELKSVFAYIEKLALEIRDSISPSSSAARPGQDDKSPDTGNPSASGTINPVAAGRNTDGASRIYPALGDTAATGNNADAAEPDKESASANTANLSSSMDQSDSLNGQDSAADTVEASSALENPPVQETGGRQEIQAGLQNGVMPETSVLSANTGESRYSSMGMLPPADGTLISRFGDKAGDLAGNGKTHKGIDIDVSKSIAVQAALDGKVTETGSSPSYGSYVRILHADGLQTIYANCSAITVNKGDIVRKGDPVAEIGGKGASVGVHLHFEVWKDGSAVNPLDYISVPES